MPKKLKLGDLFTIKTPNKEEFHACNLIDPSHTQCWPRQNGQGCYGDCSDCFRMWKERLKRLPKLPLGILSHDGKESLHKDRTTLGYIINSFIKALLKGEAKLDTGVEWNSSDRFAMHFLSIYMADNNDTVMVDIGDNNE